MKNELGRYLRPCVESLLTFCDEIRVVDDFSSDGTYQFLLGAGVRVTTANETFYAHEGRARNALLDWTLEGDPTHILHIDADEFIADGRVLRERLKADLGEPVSVWTVRMEEIWKADDHNLYIRCDGGWRAHDAPILWRVPPHGHMTGAKWRIPDKKLSCGREPAIVRENWRAAVATGTEILHFGWANQSERQARYDRYVEHDGGHYHASRHLRSIMYPDRRVKLRPRLWPAGLQTFKEQLLERVAA